VRAVELRLRELKLEGRKAFNDSDPRELVVSIFATHVTDATVSSEQNLTNVTKLFVNMQQKGNESVTDFYNTFVATRSALEAAHVAARNDPGERIQDDHVHSWTK
jgi:hypothetical protein